MSMTLKLGMQHWVLEICYQICSNDDPGLTTYFIARSDLPFLCFYMGKSLSLEFSENIEVYITKFGIYSQQYIKYMKMYGCKNSCIDLCQMSLRSKSFQTTSQKPSG